MNKYFIVVLILSLVGCTNVWVKDGANSNDFESDKYTCMQQAQQHAGAAVVNQYGGTAQEGQVTNWNLFNSCMGSKGWALTNKDAYQATAIQNQADFNRWKTDYLEATKKLDEKIKAICDKPEYAELMAKTACNANTITFEQLADSTTITQEQKIALTKYRTEVDAGVQEKSIYVHTNGKEPDKKWQDYLDSNQPEIEKYNLDLYRGSIKWGEYNQQRKELLAKIKDEWKKMFPTTAVQHRKYT